MLKLNSHNSYFNLVGNNSIAWLSTALVLLISFNLSWLLIFIRISSRLAVVKNMNRIFLDLELLLLVGSLLIIVLVVGLALIFKNLKLFIGKY